MVWLENHIPNRTDKTCRMDRNTAPYIQQFAITVEGFHYRISIESKMSDF